VEEVYCLGLITSQYLNGNRVIRGSTENWIQTVREDGGGGKERMTAATKRHSESAGWCAVMLPVLWQTVVADGHIT
jgi:hypothetical protein